MPIKRDVLVDMQAHSSTAEKQMWLTKGAILRDNVYYLCIYDLIPFQKI